MTLTKDIVRSALPRRTEYTLWHDRIPGLGLRVRPSGAKSFIFVYRNLGARSVCTIGNAAQLSLEEACTEAEQLTGKIRRGLNPARERARQRESLATAYQFYQAERMSQFSIEHARAVRRIFNRILPKLGDRKMIELRRADLETLIDPYIARLAYGRAIQVHRVLSAYLTWCVENGYLDSNPLLGARLQSRLATRTSVVMTKERREETVAPESKR